MSFRYGSLRRRRTAHRGGHHPGRDDARRHRDRGAPRRRALPPPGRQDAAAPVPRPRDRSSSPTSTSTPNSAPAQSKSPRPTIRTTSRSACGISLPMPTIMDTKGRIADTGTRFRRPGPLRCARQGARGAGRAGTHRRREAAVPAQRRALRAQRRAHRTAAVAAVVGQGRIAGQGCRRRGAQRRHRDSPAEPGAALVRLGRQHARLVHLASAVVGPPHPDLARPQRRDGLRRPRRNPAGGLGAGPRRAGHLVLLGVVAVLHAWAGPSTPPSWRSSIPQPFWSPATTSCSSGWRG